MPQQTIPGDIFVFQIEAGYALIQVLAIDGGGDDRIWHIAAFRDYFPDVEYAEAAAAEAETLPRDIPHVAMTERAFASTQAARLANKPLREVDRQLVEAWRSSDERTVSDRSIRLLLGVR
ncbi:MAG: hypothetical protein KF736_06880 [Acidobacteria bacterium]|nr:hypothetical protein [Acidobacteriota bacterium]MCW5950611.1 hypothetical protein [Pyrinomonadaceae bacterium]